ncbi:BatD family protein [Telluribacter sp. SYSU D00476]|uniref:BatD family protein n=1 Tax=Telluribacter sp. SYSU D00476 TaxID=2811430 RepID=UPI001FF2E2DB|nr:BatD family protein [Telluribacter sp. SYSU D00476]
MKLYVFLNIFLCFSLLAFGQEPEPEITIEAGNKTLAINRPFILSVIIRHSEERPQVVFPDIPGLEKRSASATSAMTTVGGKATMVQTISQQYFAKGEGTIAVPALTIVVNGENYIIEKFVLQFSNSQTDEEVSSDSEPEATAPAIGAQELSGGSIFLAVQTNKTRIYQREGFAVRLSLYVAENAPVEMEFYQLDAQLQNILKKLRPASCWEENVGIEEIVQNTVTINGKKFTEYRMYQAVYFPLTQQDVTFPAVALDMLVYEIQEKGERKRSIQKFASRPVKVQVLPLPPHPQRDQVAVGEYTLEEQVSSQHLASGESFRYVFKIKGTGNLAAVPAPDVLNSASFDFYPPEVSQVIRRSYERVTGDKTFNYFVVARQNGSFPLGRYFQWIYFDPQKARYDTLRSDKVVEVVGESRPSEVVSHEGELLMYDNLARLDTTEPYINYQGITRTLINAVVIILLVGTICMFRK